METHKPDFIVDHEFNAGNDEGKLTIKPGKLTMTCIGKLQVLILLMMML